MLAQTHRFHGYGSLKSVYNRGHNARSGFINLRYTHRSSAKSYRVAVVVSRKVSKSAVTRNRIRRRIYEQVRLNSAMITPGSDLVFSVYSDQVAELEVDRLSKIVTELLQKAT